jgi:hypothetical protein
LYRKDLLNAATTAAFSDISLLGPSCPKRAQFSYEAAADECSIWGIVAAVGPAAKYPRI